MKRAGLRIGLFLSSMAGALLVVLFAPPVLKCLGGLVALLGFFAALSFFLVSLHGSAVATPFSPQTSAGRMGATQADNPLLLPPIPRSVPEILSTMTPTRFELFSAAVIIGAKDGYQFYQHCGGSGDQGVDVKLRNVYGQKVAVQSKLYAPDRAIGSPEIREFLGSVLFHQVAYGYFVTTSTFSADARQVIESAGGRIRAIDGAQLETFLHLDRQHIALAWRDMQASVSPLE